MKIKRWDSEALRNPTFLHYDPPGLTDDLRHRIQASAADRSTDLRTMVKGGTCLGSCI